MAEDDLVALVDLIHDMIRPLCNEVEDQDPGRALCFEVAKAIEDAGYVRTSGARSPTSGPR